MPQVTLPDGRVVQAEAGTRVRAFLSEAPPGEADAIIACRINGEMNDFDRPIHRDAVIEWIRAGTDAELAVLRHSAAHVLATAVQRLFPEARFAIGPSIKDGFYYDFDVPEPFTQEDLDRIEAEARKVIAEDQPFVRSEMPREQALQAMDPEREPYKREIAQGVDEPTVSFYTNGDFRDLCRGPHLPSTGRLHADAFKLTVANAAYWRGIETNPTLQRIYGTVFRTPKELRTYLARIEEAKKRDHRKLGKAMDLFSFQEEGPGFPFWHPRGMVLYNEIVAYHRELHRRAGYQEIRTPTVLSESLWHRSGHWANYKDNMYFTRVDDRDFAIKPMNCPGGLLVYANTLHSYRELPLRWSEWGTVHRHEKSGVLHGLFRVRCFTQDDTHIFCTPDQLQGEIVGVIRLLQEIYATFGFRDIHVELSTRPARSIGADDVWEKATAALEAALGQAGLEYQLNPGEGAFYGPKIDFHILDSLERSWQCGTVQVDFSMPQRFDLRYVGSDSQQHAPVMVHRAILGSVERFIGILIEHTGGVFPTWLAPEQVRVIPVSEKFMDYAGQVSATLREQGFRAELDDSDHKVGYKIRTGTQAKVPYLLVVGEREQENGSVSVRPRGQGERGEEPLDRFVEGLRREVELRSAPEGSAPAD